MLFRYNFSPQRYAKVTPLQLGVEGGDKNNVKTTENKRDIKITPSNLKRYNNLGT